MINVILDPKLVEFGTSHHVSLGGFLRSIRAKIIFESKLKNTKFWEAVRENCLEEAYQWLSEDNQLLKTHILEEPIAVTYENIKECGAFLSSYKRRPRLLITTSGVVRDCLKGLGGRPQHVQQFFNVIDPLEEFEYCPPKSVSTCFYGGTRFASLARLNNLAAHWQKRAPIPDARGPKGLQYMHGLIDLFCQTNNGIHIMDRTILRPIADLFAKNDENGNELDGRDSVIFKLLKAVVDHDDLEDLVVVTKALPDRIPEESRKKTYDALTNLFENSGKTIKFFAIKENKYTKKVFQEFESRPYENGQFIGTCTKFDWHHFSVPDTNYSVEMQADLLDSKDNRSIAACERLEQLATDRRDEICDWMYPVDLRLS